MLANQVAIVTGASRGIGKAVAFQSLTIPSKAPRKNAIG
jgi:NADP-dependent 3-hydroxy acid dehydrogenase YdfG